MGLANKKSTNTNTQMITLKEGCWLHTNRGDHKLLHEIQTIAEPILFSNSDLRGYSFKNLLYEGITYDLERITVNNDGES